MFTLQKPKSISPLGHSADVDLRLHVDGRIIPLAQTGRTEVKLVEDIEVPPGPGRAEVIVDGVSHFSDVIITGFRPGTRWLQITDV